MRWTTKVLGLHRKFPALVQASCLMRADGALAPHFWRFRESWTAAGFFEFRSPFPMDMEKYGKARGLRFTMKKSGSRRIYELSRDSLKKRILKAADCEGMRVRAFAEWLPRDAVKRSGNMESVLFRTGQG